MSADTLTERAREASNLEGRIVLNQGGQATDLNAWIFERLPVPDRGRVLELCCGTGAQTRHFAQRVGESGRVVAVDVAEKALARLVEGLAPELRPRVRTVAAGLDDLAGVLAGEAAPGGLDVAFCAYGLYYAADPVRVLGQLADVLAPDGVLGVCGPFGPNNGALFGLLREAGVALAPEVVRSSETFMAGEVFPWMARRFAAVQVHTLVNPVRWDSPDKVVGYWRNTTFFDESRLAVVEELVRRHFAEHGEFINAKWVMLLTATQDRNRP